MDERKLLKAIKLIVQREIQEAKKDILVRVKRELNEIKSLQRDIILNETTSSVPKPQSKPVYIEEPEYSPEVITDDEFDKNPLRSILKATRPLDDGPTRDVYGEFSTIKSSGKMPGTVQSQPNIFSGITTDTDGRPINPRNQNVKKVMDKLMNMDFKSIVEQSYNR